MKQTISKKLSTAIAIISLIALVIGYIFLQYQANKTENAVYDDTIDELKVEAGSQIGAKKVVGITNAISIANDGRIKKALRNNDRKWAIKTLSFIDKKMEASTPFKNIKIHVHTKDNKSFVRSWKPEKYGDDLSSFRASVVQVNQTSKPVNTFEVGKAGLSLRSVVPVTDDNGDHLGSLEFIQGVDSIAKELDQKKDGFLLLMDQNLKQVEPDPSKIFKDYIISQNFVNQNFLEDSKTVDLEELLKTHQFSTDKYFYTYITIKDFNGQKLGIALIAEPIEKVKRAIDHAQNLIYISMGLIITLIILILVFLIISVKKIVAIPLSNLEQAIHSLIQSNDTSSRVEIRSEDEIGKVAQGFNDYLDHIEEGLKKDLILINEAEDIMDKVANGSFDQKIMGSSDNQSLNMLKENINKMIDQTQNIYSQINHLLDNYVHYDYRGNLKVEGIIEGGSLAQLIMSINSLKNSITEMLIQNKRNGLTLQQSSGELLTNVTTLSTSSNEAAASLEETAAALEEITSTIKSNNQNVTQMTSYAHTVTDAASKGEELAQKTVSSIDDINDEVVAINEAISVIDQIAFQTNILSLNAAVEAATAGEAGKGFAVVAQEVRNLASRSAEAAKEIKEIVEEATQKAGSGKNIAQQMIEGYKHLNLNIDKTIELIKEVESASKEQQAGIIQINDAINSLDQQTQQNASVATQANDIANSTQEIANNIVKNADEKEFEGKDSIKVDKINYLHKDEKPLASSPKREQMSPKKEKNIKDTTKLQEVTSTTNDDEWASF